MSRGKKLESLKNKDSLIFSFLSLDEGVWGRPCPRNNSGDRHTILSSPPRGRFCAGVVKVIGDFESPRSPEAISLTVVGWPLDSAKGLFWADGKEDFRSLG